MATADAPSTDMLSGLPEGVLHHIMSFLTLRQAVHTCVLSRRWRNLWRSMPLINADYKQFQVTNSDDEALPLFKTFVSRLLELRDPVASLDKLCLCYSISDDNSDDDSDSQDAVANRWISQALQKQARVLEVHVDLVYADLYTLVIDHSVFTSRHLTKILFSNVILGDEVFKQFETGCPALEDLSLDACIISGGKISSQTLKVLTISDTKFSMEHETNVSTPSITSLTLWNPGDRIPVLKDMVSAVTASVKLSVFSDDFDARGLHQYLWALSGVKSLEFYYLGRKSSPKLEMLTQKLNPFRYQQTSQRIVGELNERSFTCRHLTIIEVICSDNDPLANHVIDFFVSSEETASFEAGVSASPRADTAIAIAIATGARVLLLSCSVHAHHLFDETPLRDQANMATEYGRNMDEEQESSVYMLNDLPDDLMRPILSLLDSRQAVRMCLLSRRWNNLWCSLTCIRVDFCEFSGETDTWEGDQARFRKFVNNLLLRRDPVLLDKFCLRSCIPSGANDQQASADANLWISHALQLQAQVVEVDQDILTKDTLELGAHAIFTTKYLRKLVLSAVSFTEVKVLFIDNSEFSYDYDISISTPSVTSLTLIDPGGRLPLLKDMGSLVSASVYLSHDADNLDTAINIDQWLTGLSSARRLVLDFPVNAIEIKDNMQWCPKFFNLVKLTLGRWCIDTRLYALIVFLQNSPKLEKLTLEIDEGLIKKSQASLKKDHLHFVEVTTVEDDPLKDKSLEGFALINRVKMLFRNSGMTSLQIDILHLDYYQRYESELPRPPPVRRNALATPAATGARASTPTTCSTKRLSVAIMEPGKSHGCRGRDRLRLRINDLTDDLILRIMSSLDAHLAVRTCVLSWRWHDLWCSLTRISADTIVFKGENEISMRHPGQFKKFVNTLLLRRYPFPLVDKFWLRCYIPTGAWFKEASADAHLWISHVLQLQTPVLEFLVLQVKLRPKLTVFTSQYLKRLALSNVDISEGFFNPLEMSCPKLEHIYLGECNIQDYNISSQSKALKILTIGISDFVARKDITNESNTQWCPKFNNLVRLYLGWWCLELNYYALTVFLQNSPKLEKLILELNYDYTRIISVKLKQRSFTCEHLKVVEVICIVDDPLVNRGPRPPPVRRNASAS
uniref:F-box domain-containing protein n=1 Tax=Leersia perrieri TaxID=77586 RepID=A0A0D9XHH6_9ORYZ